MENVESYAEAVVRLEQVKRDIKALEDEETSLTETIKTGKELGQIDDEEIKMIGLVPNKRTGGYKDDVCYLLKQKGLREAILTKEAPDQKQVKEYEETGVLTAEELAEYKKADSWFLSLPREKK